MTRESKPVAVPLFRPEVIEAQRESWLGGISLAQPVHLWVLAVFAGLAATLVATLLFFGEYARRSKVTGRLIPNLGLSTVLSPTAGLVQQLFPEEGDRVGAGAPLMLITVPRATASGADVQEVLARAIDQQRASLESSRRSRAARRTAREAGLRRQLATAKRELAQTETQAATRGQQVVMARETLQRYERLGEPYVSVVQLRQQEQSVLEQVSIQQELERAASTIRRQIAQLEQALRELPAERAEQDAALQRDLALLTQERVQQESGGELLIKAPVAGVVASRRVEPGQTVQAGQALLTLLPDGSRLQAELFVPSRAVGFIDPGDRVLLRYQAYPYQKFGHHGGRVIRVSRSAIMPDVPVGTTGRQEVEPYYRVLVALDQQTITVYGQPEPLRPGMLLDAHVMGESRKLYEWALSRCTPCVACRGIETIATPPVHRTPAQARTQKAPSLGPQASGRGFSYSSRISETVLLRPVINGHVKPNCRHDEIHSYRMHPVSAGNGDNLSLAQLPYAVLAICLGSHVFSVCALDGAGARRHQAHFRIATPASTDVAAE